MRIDKSRRYDAAGAIDPPHGIGGLEASNFGDSPGAQ